MKGVITWFACSFPRNPKKMQTSAGNALTMRSLLRIIIIIVAIVGLGRLTMIGWRLRRERPPGRDDTVRSVAGILKAHVVRLARDIGDRSVFRYERLLEARDYIAAELAASGYAVEFQEFTSSGRAVHNVIAEKRGTSEPDRIIVVGAHYDTCFNPGADDNASAVAGMLELARFLAGKDADRTVRFVAFVNEEPPFFKGDEMGSRVYARRARRRDDDIRAAVILESIGYYSDRLNSQRYPPLLGPFFPNRGNFIAVVGNRSSRDLVSSLSEGFRKKTSFPIETIAAFGFVPGIDLSDHWAFWKEGYPAVMVTDTAFFRNPHYHRPTDTYEKLDYDRMAEVVKGLKGSLLDLAGRRDE